MKMKIEKFPLFSFVRKIFQFMLKFLLFSLVRTLCFHTPLFFEFLSKIWNCSQKKFYTPRFFSSIFDFFSENFSKKKIDTPRFFFSSFDFFFIPPDFFSIFEFFIHHFFYTPRFNFSIFDFFFGNREFF